MKNRRKSTKIIGKSMKINRTLEIRRLNIKNESSKIIKTAITIIRIRKFVRALGVLGLSLDSQTAFAKKCSMRKFTKCTQPDF